LLQGLREIALDDRVVKEKHELITEADFGHAFLRPVGLLPAVSQ